jgi:hypothetical protein
MEIAMSQVSHQPASTRSLDDALPLTRPVLSEPDSLLAALSRLLEIHAGLAQDIRRIADALDPPPPDLVGTPYVAQKLGCTTTWIADLIRRGEIPGNCLVAGTGNGKPWKFYRERIDRWIRSR